MHRNELPPAWSFAAILAQRTRTSGEKRTPHKGCPTGKSLLIIRNRVKPENQKYSAFHVEQINGTSFAHPGPQEGRFAIVTIRGSECDGRFCFRHARACKTTERRRTAKSCGPGAAMLALSWREVSRQ